MVKLKFTYDLVNTNSNALLAGADAVFCGNCKTKTAQNSERNYKNPDLFIIEIIRVKPSDSKYGWAKNHAPLSFTVGDLKLPGFIRPYSVLGSCHHRGSLNGGHWITKILTKNGWFELDDLQRNYSPTNPPGKHDDSISVILLVAKDKISLD